MLGTYVCNDLDAELVITEEHVATGQGKGTFRFGKVTWSVTIHYHYKNSGGPETSLCFWGWKDDPNHYLGGAGFLPNNASITEINLAGGFASIDNCESFSGIFERA